MCIRDSSYTSRVIANFVPNFLAMATGVDTGKMQLAAFNGPSPKTPLYAQKSRRYFLHRPSYSQFCPKLRCHGRVKLNDTIRLAIPKNHTYNPKLRLYLIHSQSYDRFKNCLIFPIGSIVIFWNFCNKYY